MALHMNPKGLPCLKQLGIAATPMTVPCTEMNAFTGGSLYLWMDPRMRLLPWEKPMALNPPLRFGSARIFSANTSTDLSMFMRKPLMVSDRILPPVGIHLA